MSNHSNTTEKISMGIIKLARKYFLNTWVQRLPFMEWVYKKVFYMGRQKTLEEIIFRGYPLLVHTKDITMVPSLINGEFEKYELTLFEKIIKPGMNIIDIGANIGVYAIAASKASGKNGMVHAFEPVPENISLLKKNITLNKLKNVTVINSAVGDKPGKVSMSIVNDSLATHHIGKKASKENSIEVDVITLDDYVKKAKLKVDLIKMDIEGYEGYAIEGAQQTLKQKNLILLTEFSADFITRSGKNPEEVAKKLYSLFTFCYTINERKQTVTPVDNYQDMLDPKNHDFIFSRKPLDI